MRKLVKKIFVLLLISIILVTGPSIKTFAKMSNGEKTTIDKIFPLYNLEDEIVAYYVSLSNGGYIITNSDGSDFIEYSIVDVNVDLDYNNKHYYTSPHCVFEEEGRHVKNIYTKEVHNTSYLEEQEFKIKAIYDGNASSKVVELATKVVAETTIIKEQKALRYSTFKYDYNNDGRCGAVAAAIVLRYYDDYVNDKYLATAYETSDGVKLINMLTSDYLGTGTSAILMKIGIDGYLTSRGLANRLQMLLGSNYSATVRYNRVKTNITSNLPLILDLDNHPTYGEHWVVCTGYSITYSETYGVSKLVIINDGWGNTQIRINFNYVGDVLYII